MQVYMFGIRTKSQFVVTLYPVCTVIQRQHFLPLVKEIFHIFDTKTDPHKEVQKEEHAFSKRFLCVLFC
jgi:hypothetical protein